MSLNRLAKWDDWRGLLVKPYAISKIWLPASSSVYSAVLLMMNMLRIKVAVMLLALGVLCPSGSVSANEIPRELFGIRLGAQFKPPPEFEDAGDSVPYKRATGSQNRIMGTGIHLYVEPRKTYKAFPYIEYPEPDNKYFTTSFRLLVLPVIPDSVISMEKLGTDFEWEVVLIEWADSDDESDGYFWAEEMCKTFSLDFNVEPTIVDQIKQDWYECRFVSNDRVFKISSQFRKEVALKYVSGVIEQKSNAVEDSARRLQLEEIRPY